LVANNHFKKHNIGVFAFALVAAGNIFPTTPKHV